MYSLSQHSDGTGTQIETSQEGIEFDFTDAHPSEIALDNYEFDEVIINDGNVESLSQKVKEILLKYKII